VQGNVSLRDTPDSVAILRADFERRSADTVGFVGVPVVKLTSGTQSDGRKFAQTVVNPVQFVDDWCLLPDGTVAILRGHDYHIDWIRLDGSRVSSPKMPFDWRRLTDADKTAIIDSTRKALAKAAQERARSPARGTTTVSGSSGGSSGSASAAASSPERSRDVPVLPPPDVADLRDLPDYYPPVFVSGTMRADRSGNVWILPTTSSHAGGGLLYDVVNRNGQIFERVRLPLGRTLAGFGPGGTVFLAAHDPDGERLERAHLNSR